MKPAPTEFPRRGGPNDIGDARPPGEGPDPAADPDRVEAVLRALSRLRRRDPFPLAQGLSAPNAEECLGLAINEIRREGLLQELSTPGRRPPDVTVVCAHGVFTSPLEWACLYAAAGMRVRLKAPARDPAFCLALAEVLAQEGLPVSADTSRDLGDPSAVVAFGGDESIEAIRLATPQARHVGFGHRFSLVLCEPRPELAQAIAWEHALYDTRGCMAPAAVLVLGDPRPLEEALRQAMPLAELALPRGRVDPTLGPEWRRRLALARATGSAFEGESWAVLRIPPAHFVPFALPRMVSLYPVQSATEVEQLLSPWRMQLSTLSTDDILRARLAPEQWAGVYGAFHRLTPLGGLQRPPFPRRHDGLPMLGCLLEPSIS